MPGSFAVHTRPEAHNLLPDPRMGHVVRFLSYIRQPEGGKHCQSGLADWLRVSFSPKEMPSIFAFQLETVCCIMLLPRLLLLLACAYSALICACFPSVFSVRSTSRALDLNSAPLRVPFV